MGSGGRVRLDPLEDEDGEVVHARGVGRGRAPALEGPVGRHRGGPTGFVVFEGDDPDDDSMDASPPQMCGTGERECGGDHDGMIHRGQRRRSRPSAQTEARASTSQTCIGSRHSLRDSETMGANDGTYCPCDPCGKKSSIRNFWKKIEIFEKISEKKI